MSEEINWETEFGKLIEAETGKRFEKVQTKIGKYTSKYHK